MPKPKNEGETRKVEITIPARLHDYLVHLSRNSVLGVTPNDVARYLLTERVMQLIQVRFHETDLPSRGD